MTQPEPYETRTLSGMRGVIARHMLESLSSAAQLTYFATADASGLVDARDAWKSQGNKVGYEDIILSCLCASLEDYPDFNGIARGKDVQVHQEVRISVAVALPDGLVAPALSDLRGLIVPEISVLRRNLVDRARQGRLSVAEMKAGTFTISNLGATRVDHFTPILNGGQIGLLGVGQIANKPAALGNGSVGIRPELGLSLTTDHRFVDGAPSGAFLTSLIEKIEKHPPFPGS